MNERRRILVVDDEEQIRLILRKTLAKQGYEVQTAIDGAMALEIFRNWPPDLVVTDLSMPTMNGLELCRQLSAISNVPIIVLTVRGEQRDKVEALDAGADDYVTKPFGMDELLARLRALLRRAPITAESVDSIIQTGDFRIDFESRNVTVGGRYVRLTPKEFDLLLYLVRHPAKVLTHRTLITAIWGGGSLEQTESLRFFVGQLRKKIEPEPATPRYILTEPWIGYRFNPGS
jgi:two-component system, OmpR family, KDP operon response regulator KdpE